MRTLRVAAALLMLLVAASPAVADRHGGNGVGAQAGPYSAGTMDVWRVYVGGPGTLAAALTWVASPIGADYDLTLWRPGADLDGVLSQGEMLAASWTRSRAPGESLSHSVAPDPRAYVLTVEAVSAELETYYLDATGGEVVRTCHRASEPTRGATCLWTAHAVKCLSREACPVRP